MKEHKGKGTNGDCANLGIPITIKWTRKSTEKTLEYPRELAAGYGARNWQKNYPIMLIDRVTIRPVEYT